MLVANSFKLNKPITLLLCIGWVIVLIFFEWIVWSKGNYWAFLGGGIAIIALLLLVFGTSITFYDSHLVSQNYFFIKRSIAYKHIAQVSQLAQTTYSTHGYHKLKLINLHMDDDRVKPLIISHYKPSTANEIIALLKAKAPQAVWL